MFFVLSKVLNFFTHPIVIVCLFFLLSVLVTRQSWKKRFFWIGFTLLFFFSNDFIANEIMHAWEIQPVSFSSLPKQYTYGIILTGVTMGKRVPDDRVYFGRGADRVVHTVQLYKLGHIKKILISGGNGSLTEKEEKEADELKKVILIMGVKEEDILLENTSRNTHESAVEVKKILDKGINPDECILITSAFHMRRSRACFHKVGLDLNTFSTDIYTHERRFTPDSLVLPSEEALIVWGKLMKEWTGFVAYKVAGYV